MDPGDKLRRLLLPTTRNKLPSLNFLIKNHLSLCLVKGLDQLVALHNPLLPALMTTSDDVDSDDDYVTEQEVDSHDEQDSD